jgi:hypothetical protein
VIKRKSGDENMGTVGYTSSEYRTNVLGSIIQRTTHHTTHSAQNTQLLFILSPSGTLADPPPQIKEMSKLKSKLENNGEDGVGGKGCGTRITEESKLENNGEDVWGEDRRREQARKQRRRRCRGSGVLGKDHRHRDDNYWTYDLWPAAYVCGLHLPSIMGVVAENELNEWNTTIR